MLRRRCARMNISEKMNIMQRWKEAGALQSPYDMPVYRRTSRGASEGCLTLILRMARDLMIARVSIKETKERMICQPFQHFVDELKRDLVALFSFFVAYAHSPPRGGSLGN